MGSHGLGYMVNKHGLEVIVFLSPEDRVGLDPLENGLSLHFMAYKWGVISQLLDLTASPSSKKAWSHVCDRAESKLPVSSQKVGMGK